MTKTIYWNNIGKGEKYQIYVATSFPLSIGQEVSLTNSIGYIMREKDGSWSAFLGQIGWISNEPNKQYAMDSVYKYAKEYEEHVNYSNM